MPSKDTAINKSSPTRSVMIDALEELKASCGMSDMTQAQKFEEGIADIMTFCYDQKLLDLKGANLTLHRSQELVLKAFYMGSVGNRRLRLTEDDWKWLEDNELKGDNRTSAEKLRYREKMMSADPAWRFTELTLVLGRRSGKTLMASIVAAYEAYKLLVINEGDPHGYYGLPINKQIYILNVATSQEQAHELFGEIKARIGHSPFFANRIEHDTETMVRLLTDRDLRQRRDDSTNVKLQGSVVVMCGHRNYKSLLGKAAICIIFDELSFYDEGQKVSGRDFYNHLKPSISQFDRKNDGVLVEISSPGIKGGIMHERATEGLRLESTTMYFRVPTWIFNPNMPETNKVLAECKQNSPEMYAMLYGAEWPEGGASSNFFPAALIDRAIEEGARANITTEGEPEYGAEYYAHVDPAVSGDNYALVVVRRKVYRDFRTGANSIKVMLVYTKVWRPVKDVGLPMEEIERDIIQVCSKFHVTALSYDVFPSRGTEATLRRYGINTVRTPFNRGYKNRIFVNLRNMMAKEECECLIYDDPLLVSELKNLKQKPLQHGLWLGADKRSDVKTDDLADALAGAAFMACGNYFNKWPGAVLISTGLR